MSQVDVLPLGDAVKPTRPRVKPSDHPGLPFIGLEHVEAHSMKLLGTVAATTMKSSAVHFKPGDVLYGRLRPYLNKVYRPTFEGLCSAEFIVLPENERVDGGFLQYFLNAAAFVRFASHLNTGDRPRVDFDQLAPYEMPLPKVGEQRRIVAELEKQFSRLDEAVANLKRVKANLERFRASVYQAAVEGVLLVEPSRADRGSCAGAESAEALLARASELRRTTWKGRGKYRAPENPPIDSLPPIPVEWVWASWGQVGHSQNGRAFPSSEYTDEGVRLLRPGNMHQAGIVVWDEGNTRYLPERYASTDADLIVKGGELVMNLTAQSLKDEFLGRVCLTSPGERCLLNQRLARLTPCGFSARYALVVFKSRWFRTFVDGLNTGSLIQHMFTSQLDRFPFPLPPLDEQHRIVAEVDRRLSIVREVEAEVDTSLKRAQALRQVVLARAFATEQRRAIQSTGPSARGAARQEGELTDAP